MNADRSESRRSRNPWRAAAIAERATGPISMSSPPNATRRKLSSVKSLLRFTSTVIRRSSGARRMRTCSSRVQCRSGLGGVPEEELALRGGVDAGDVLGCGGQVVVEVGEDDRGLVEEEPLDLPGDAPLAGDVDGGDVVACQLVEGGVVEPRGVPGAGPGLGVDGVQRRAEVDVGDRAGAVVDQAHLAVQ